MSTHRWPPSALWLLICAASASACNGPSADVVDASIDRSVDAAPAAMFDFSSWSADASAPPVSAGVLTALQENGGPNPEVVVLVGCPKDGIVTVAPYAITDPDLSVTPYGPFVGAYRHVNSRYSIVVLGPGATPLFEIEYDTTQQIAGQVAPFAYVSNVTIDPSVVTVPRPFRAIMPNPMYPMATTLGFWNSDKLVICP